MKSTNKKTKIITMRKIGEKTKKQYVKLGEKNRQQLDVIVDIFVSFCRFLYVFVVFVISVIFVFLIFRENYVENCNFGEKYISKYYKQIFCHFCHFCHFCNFWLLFFWGGGKRHNRQNGHTGQNRQHGHTRHTRHNGHNRQNGHNRHNHAQNWRKNRKKKSRQHLDGELACGPRTPSWGAKSLKWRKCNKIKKMKTIKTMQETDEQ